MAPMTEREAVARQATLLQLAAAHDKFSSREVKAVERGDYQEAQVHHNYVLWIVRAYQVELTDPEPEA